MRKFPLNFLPFRKLTMTSSKNVLYWQFIQFIPFLWLSIEVLKARGKLNVVLLSWERKCWTTLSINELKRRKTCWGRCYVGQSSQVRVWNSDLTFKTPWIHQDNAILLPQRIIHYMNELYKEEAQKVGLTRNCSQYVQVDFRPTRNDKSKEHITVRNSYKNWNDPCS